jgi:hypothetical protein
MAALRGRHAAYLAGGFRELPSELRDLFSGWSPVRIAGITVELQRTGFQSSVEFFVTEFNCNIVTVGTDQIEIQMVAHFEVLPATECITRREIAGLQTAAKPVHALRRTPVCKTLRTDMPGRHTLQTIVTHRGGGAQPGGDVGFIDDFALCGSVGPYARIAICLQLQADRKGIRLGGVGARQFVHFALDPE